MGHGTGNNRNGTSPKQVLTEIGAVDLFPETVTPRSNRGSFLRAPGAWNASFGTDNPESDLSFGADGGGVTGRADVEGRKLCWGYGRGR